jgi:hypothetical protein
MKQVIRALIFILVVFLIVFCESYSTQAQSFSENFNTLNANNQCDRTVYSNRCWVFKSAEVSNTNAIDGCSVRSSQLSNSTVTPVAGGNRVNFPFEITTPALRITSPASVTFNAAIINTTSNPTLYVIADPVSSTANSFTLATIPTSSAGLTTSSKAFTASFTPPSGDYTIRFGIVGTGGTSRLILDNVFVSNISAVAQPTSCRLAPLPVTLTEFRASQTADGCTVQLQWTTSLELNNKAFIVERSADARSFEPIGSIAGKGTTNQMQHYSFDDSHPLPVSYYRLKQVDIDQHFEYSKIIAMVSRCSPEGLVFQYSQEMHQLDILVNQSTIATPLSVDLFDSAGRRLHSLTVQNAQPMVSIDTTPFSSSFLIIRITDGSGKLLRSQRLFLP